jgi:integrase
MPRRNPHQTASVPSQSPTEAPEVVDVANIDAAVQRRLPALGIDAGDPLEMASLAHVHEAVKDAVDRNLFDSPLSAASKNQYQSSIAVFDTWCATRPDPIKPLQLSSTARVAVVATFLTWLASDVADDDAAVGLGAGRRWRRTALKAESIGVYSSALRWWAQQHEIDDPVPTLAVADLIKQRRRSVPERQAAPFGNNEVQLLLAAIRLGPGAKPAGPGCPAAHVDVWVAANSAATLAQYCGGMRVSERLRLRDEWVTVADDRLVLHLPSSKGRHAGRTIDLYGDPDPECCPVRAIQHWLEVAERHCIDRQGLLLPIVTGSAVRLDGDRRLAAWVFKQIATSAGLMDRSDSELHYVATHSLRRGRATALASLGADIETLRRLLGHAKAETTLKYVDRATLAPTDWVEELGL